MTVTDNEAIEAAARAMAKADGLDFDEVCGYETEADDCDSSTCIAAHSEDHDATLCRGWYRKWAAAVAPALMEEGARLERERVIDWLIGFATNKTDELAELIAAGEHNPAAIVKGAGHDRD